MTKFLFMSDIHLNHCSKPEQRNFFERLSKFKGKDVIIAGDISDGVDSLAQLDSIKKCFANARVNYVLGNHDFWKMPSMEECRKMHADSMNMKGPRFLPENIWLMGMDGFYDCPFDRDNPYDSHDTHFIKDISNKKFEETKEAIRKQAKHYVDLFKCHLDALPEDSSPLLLVTHVPPFKVPSNCRDRPDSVSGMYVCQSLGKLLNTLDRKIVVLCGHTHESCDIIMGYVRQISFAAEYGYPEARILHINELFDFE